MIIPIILILIICIYIHYINNCEHMNEGTFMRVNKYTNYNSSLFPICQKNVRNNSLNERYCDDKKPPNMIRTKVFNNNRWIITKYPSYIYSASVLSTKPQIVFSPDYSHIIQ
jgi:hypothetical protein